MHTATFPNWMLSPLGTSCISLLAGLALLVVGTPALADPPSQAARIGYMAGNISFSPAGEDDWFQGSLNRPLTRGDRLWSAARGRAEIQMGPAVVRMGGETSLTLLNLDDEIIQLQLTHGTLHVRVRRLDARQVFEIDTPNLAFVIRQPGDYRIDVDPDGDATTLAVRKGRGEAYGNGAAYLIQADQHYRFTGTDLDDYDALETPRTDDFDRWAMARERRLERSTSALYVSPDVVGYEDLDSAGDWRSEPNLGSVWYPRVGASGWAPYRDGYWSWIDPWGWTWVDDQPWGYAVSHYGRWAHLRNRWAWVPGPRTSRAYYAPALVAFVGGDNFQLTLSSGSVSGIGWFPLAPREVYRPSYAVSRGYYENINRSNTTIHTTVINNTYNNSNITNVVYVNRDVPGAVVAVPTTVFVQSQPVSRAAVRLAQAEIASAPPAMTPRLAPTVRSVQGPSAKGDRPPGRSFERPVVARATPPPRRAAFAEQQKALAAQPGRPLDEVARKALRTERNRSSPGITVVPATVAAPAEAPPRTNRTDRQNNRPDQKGRDRAAERTVNGREHREGASVQPLPAMPGKPVEAPATQAPRDRGNDPTADKHGNRETRENRDDRDGRNKRDNRDCRGNRSDAPLSPLSPRDVKPAPPQPPVAAPPIAPPPDAQPPRAQPPEAPRPAIEPRERKNERPGQDQRERRNERPQPAAAPVPSKEIQPVPQKVAPTTAPAPAAAPPSQEIKPEPPEARGRGKDKKKDDDEAGEKGKGKK